MSNGSENSNKPTIQPDVSPKRKAKFNYREVGAAITILIIVVVAAILLAVGLRNNYERDLERATAEAENLKTEYATKLTELANAAKKLDEREKEVATRETKVSAREKAVKEAEEKLESERLILDSDRSNFTIEEEDFFDKQIRVRELCEALLLELTPEDDE